MSPIEIVKIWIDAFNAKDAEKIAQLYSENAINHQVANEPIIGHDNIKAMFREEFSKFEMVCIVENLFQDGEWAILEWKDPNGLRGCGFFHIIDNKIEFQRGYWDKMTMLIASGCEVIISNPNATE